MSAIPGRLAAAIAAATVAVLVILDAIKVRLFRTGRISRLPGETPGTP